MEEVYNAECPICLEETKEIKFITSCGHAMHISCIKDMETSLCPLCRSVVLNWPDEIGKRLESNEKKRKEEMIEEEREAILRSEQEYSRAMYEMITNGSFSNAYPEHIAAIEYLRRQGIDDRFIPQSVEIVSLGTNQPPPGAFFSAFVGETLDRIQNMLSSSDDEDDSEL